MHVSIKDIAKAAGVSHSIVSRALSDSPLVKAETRACIKRLAQEMGYTPDAITCSLVTQRTRTVGMVVPPYSKNSIVSWSVPRSRAALFCPTLRLSSSMARP